MAPSASSPAVAISPAPATATPAPTVPPTASPTASPAAPATAPPATAATAAAISSTVFARATAVPASRELSCASVSEMSTICGGTSEARSSTVRSRSTSNTGPSAATRPSLITMQRFA